MTRLVVTDRKLGLVVVDNGKELAVSTTTLPGAVAPCGVAVLGPDIVAVADSATGDVYVGNVVTGSWKIGPPRPAGGLDRPSGVWPADGGLLVADTGSHRVLRVDADLTIQAVVVAAGVMRAPTSVTVARDGRIWVADQRDGLFVLDPAGQPTAVPLPSVDGGKVPVPVHVAVGVGDGVVVTDLVGTRVLLVDADGAATPVTVDGATENGVGLRAPMAAVVDASGLSVVVSVLDVGTSRIVQLTSGAEDVWTVIGEVRAEADDGARRFSRAVSMALEVAP